MSKLARKFLIGLSAVLLLVTLLSIYLNSNFIQRYYLLKEKQDLNRVSDQLALGGDLEATIQQLEEENDVLIAWLANTDDNSLLNARLREAFLSKGITLGGYGNFWLWDQDWKEAMEQGRKLKIYQQEKLHYSLMVQYVSVEDSFLAAVKIIPAMGRTISLINLVTTCVFLGAALVMVLVVFFLVRRITTPLIRIGETAKAIANLDFQTVEVRTGDELELLAGDINDMSGKLQTAHRELEAKTQQMESLLANVSHDLKTPVSLIKAYASGIQDGMDDGTFLDTILLQNEKMEGMIERLLDLARLQQQEANREPVSISTLLDSLVGQYRLQAQARGISFVCQIEPDLVLKTGKDAVQSIFENLLSNAVKYAGEGEIALTLCRREIDILFQIQNRVQEGVVIDPQRLWEPFYVAEESRNKSISGTGLGLSIVRAAVQNYGYDCSCTVQDTMICFTVQFKI